MYKSGQNGGKGALPRSEAEGRAPFRPFCPLLVIWPRGNKEAAKWTKILKRGTNIKNVKNEINGENRAKRVQNAPK